MKEETARQMRRALATVCTEQGAARRAMVEGLPGRRENRHCAQAQAGWVGLREGLLHCIVRRDASRHRLLQRAARRRPSLAARRSPP